MTELVAELDAFAIVDTTDGIRVKSKLQVPGTVIELSYSVRAAVEAGAVLSSRSTATNIDGTVLLGDAMLKTETDWFLLVKRRCTFSNRYLSNIEEKVVAWFRSAKQKLI